MTIVIEVGAEEIQTHSMRLFEQDFTESATLEFVQADQSTGTRYASPGTELTIRVEA